MHTFCSPHELLACIGNVYSAGTILVTQEMVDEFANATHDHQWIHVDQNRAAHGPFGGTIAHGYLTLSLVPAFLSQAFDVQGINACLNYGVNRVRFPAPVPVGSSLVGSVRLAEASAVASGVQAEWAITMEGSNASKPFCVADVVVRYIFAESDRRPAESTGLGDRMPGSTLSPLAKE